MKKSLLVLASAAALMAGQVSAQTAPAAAPAQPAMNPGPVIPGVCVYSVEDAIAGSDVGKSAGERMRQLSAAVEAEIKPERTAIETEGKSLQDQVNAKTLQGEALQTKAQAFQGKVQGFEQKVQLRGQELQATEAKAQRLIATDLEPQLRAVYTEKGCGILVDRNSVLFANPAMDITGQVVTKLNAVKKTMTFDRERITPQARPTAAAPAPAAATKKN
jgi:outer membrane protein